MAALGSAESLVQMSGETMSPTVAELFTALAKAQAEIEGAKKDSVNPHLKNKYADLASVWSACRSVLPKHGLCAIQTTAQAGPGGVCVVTTLGHTSGEWIRGEMYMPATKQDAQKFAYRQGVHATEDEAEALCMAFVARKRYATATAA